MTHADVIYKYPLNIRQVNALNLSPAAVPVCVAMQGDQLCLWARQMHTAPARGTRSFTVVGTGQPFPASWLFIGTCQDGPFVWHVFEVKP